MSEELKEKPWLSWNHCQVIELIPPQYHERIHIMIADKSFGYKGLLKHLYDAERYSQAVQTHLTKAIHVLTSERQAPDVASATRNKNRNYLATLENDVLEKYCTKYNVSYASFMNSNDRQGLIEAIVDEMMNI